jgi:hypothetical protein
VDEPTQEENAAAPEDVVQAILSQGNARALGVAEPCDEGARELGEDLVDDLPDEVALAGVSTPLAHRRRAHVGRRFPRPASAHPPGA